MIADRRFCVEGLALADLWQKGDGQSETRNTRELRMHLKPSDVCPRSCVDDGWLTGLCAGGAHDW